MTAFASWLDTAFAGYDHAILEFLHEAALSAGSFLTPVAKAVTFIGEKGILLLLIALILMLFSKTRKIGICMFGAVCCGALITNICLKDTVARARPFYNESSDYFGFWQTVGSPAEDGFSFPSGHVTAAMAGTLAFCLAGAKKWAPVTLLYVVLMGISRNYLMAHYPSDVLGAIIVGAISAVVAFLITKLIYHVLEKYRSNGFCKFVLDFDMAHPSK